MSDAVERVLVVVAHPDDAEAGAGGTLAKLVRQGANAALARARGAEHG